METIYKGSNQYFSDNFFEFFDRAQLRFLEDSRDEAFIPFKNGVVKITKDGITVMEYGSIDSVIWKSQVIDHYVTIENDFAFENVEYYKFLERICDFDNDKMLYAIGLIGYLLHKYKDPARPFAVILCEETEHEAKGGGTGKGIFNKALGYICNLVVVDGKNFKVDKNFAFQRVDLDTRLLAIEDTRRNVDFEGFYSIITEGITVEKKNKDELRIPYKDSPKVIFTTNYTIPNSGNHAKRRQKVFEFSGYFSPQRTPEDEFGHKLFEDWDKDEWNRFYNLMFHCVQDYLENGITNVPPSDKLSRKQIRVQFGEEFLDYFMGLEEESGNVITLERLYNDFLSYGGFDKKDYSQKRFTKAFEESCAILKMDYEVVRDRSNNNKKCYKINFTKKLNDEYF
jgi:phage/plasmid-associated DNA primase